MRVPLLLTIGVSLCLGAQASASPQGEQFYRTLQGIEDQWPLPNARATVRVGSFDPATGTFTFDANIKSRVVIIPPSTPGEHPHRVQEFSVPVNAAFVTLRFDLLSPCGQCLVEVSNHGLATVTPTSAVIDVKDDDAINFTIRSGSFSVNKQFNLVRPRVIGAGSFVVPALPLAVVYTPQQGLLGGSTATFSRVTSHVIKRALKLETENSTLTGEFDSIDAIKSAAVGVKDIWSDLKDAGVLTSSVGGAYVAAAFTALQLLTSAFESTNVSDETGFHVTSEHELVSTDERTYTTPTSDQGPGVSDRILYYHNVHGMWLNVNGVVHLGILSATEQVDAAVSDLRADLARNSADRVSGLDDESLRDLLALDPFVHSVNVPFGSVTLPRPRFSLVDDPSTITVIHGMPTVSFAKTIAKDDVSVRVDTATHIEVRKPGWLSFVGIGPSESRTTKEFFSQSTATDELVGERLETTVKLNAGVGERYSLTVLYDHLFGTFAFSTPGPITGR